MTPKTLGRILKFGRERRGWTQEELAQESGVSRLKIENWEKGKGLKSSCSFLAAFLSVCDIDQLVRGTSTQAYLISEGEK